MKRLWIAAAVVVCLLSPACGGGGGGGGGGAKPVGEFVVKAVEPRTGMSNVSDDYAVRILVNAPVEGLSVTASSFYVALAGDTVPRTGTREVSDDGLRLTFKPSPRFTTSTAYDVHVTQLLRARDGRFLAKEFTSTFRTGPWASPEPVTQSQFRTTANPMGFGRSRHTQTTIPFTVEVVLVAGGYTSGAIVTNTAEVYNPGADEFFPAVGRMSDARANHTATLVEGGFVLLTGGEKLDPDGVPIALATTELFAVASTTFVPGPLMSRARSVHTATLLDDGRVLIAGGDVYDEDGYPEATNTAEIYDPHPFPGSFAPAANTMEIPRSGHQATLLADGRVLFTGGSTSRNAEIFDPATNRFTRTKGRLIFERWRHGANVLPSGRVLISDGGTQEGELFDPATETFAPVPGGDSMSRYGAQYMPFRNGEVLILGGFAFLPDGNILLHANMDQYMENYGPYGSYFQVMTLPPNGVYLGDARAYSASSRLADGRWLVTGGLGPAWDQPDLSTALLFDPSVE